MSTNGGSVTDEPTLEDPRADAPGLIAGRFRIGGLLGTGGSASVFRATDTHTGDVVAVKLLHPHLSTDDALGQAFIAQAERMSRLRHPHLAATLAAGVHGNGPDRVVWIAQELAPGTTLAEWVAVHGPLSIAHTIAVGGGLLDALDAVHAAGVVHRDVSASNVMIEVDRDSVTSVRLLDFGLADAAGRASTGSDVVRGGSDPERVGVIANVHYASPEHLRGEPVDERGDLYQTGGLLFFALTGRPPYAGGDQRAVIRSHLQAPPPVPSVHRRDISQGLDRLIVRALLKHPDDRFPSARAMADELAIVTPPAARPEQATQQRTRILAAAAVPEPTTATPDARRRDRIAGGWTLLAAIILAAAVAAAVLPAATSSSTGPTPTPTPSVAATPTPSPAEPEQPPPAAPALVAVPQLGMLADVDAALGAAGLTRGSVTTVDSPLPADTVLAQNPAPGTQVDAGTAVSLTVASGSNLLPEVSGQPGERAIRMLSEAGFEVEQTLVAASTEPPGTVLAMQPLPAASVRVGTVVWLYVADPAVSTPTPTPQPTPEPEPTGP